MSPSRRRLLTLLLALGLLLVLAGPALAVEVVVSDEDGLQPEVVTVEVGETLDLVNGSSAAIRFMDDGGRWDSGPLAPGEVFSISFDQPGTMSYSSADGTLTGTIEIVDPAATPDPEPSPEPSADPTGDPEPTAEPTTEPTPSEEPTAEPEPTTAPEPTAAPTDGPTAQPTPTESASDAPLPGMASTGAPVLLMVALSVAGLLGGTLVLRRT